MKKSVNLDSHCLSRAQYDTREKTLTLTFNSGREYVYDNVSEDVFDLLVSGGSAGRKFNSLIKGKFSYRKL